MAVAKASFVMSKHQDCVNQRVEPTARDGIQTLRRQLTTLTGHLPYSPALDVANGVHSTLRIHPRTLSPDEKAMLNTVDLGLSDGCRVRLRRKF
jgi:hypothetical protein